MTERVVRKYYAQWCAPCKAVQPKLEAVAEEYGAHIEEVDIEQRPEEAQALGIRAIPSIFLYEDEELKVHRMGIGNITLDNLRSTFEAAYNG